MAGTIVKNTIANVVTKIWTILSLYLFVPIWIYFLGVEGYGVISFYTVLMTIMHFADAGLTATLTREFARGDKDDQYRRDLLRTIEFIYWGIASVLFFLVFLHSGDIVNIFLKSDTLTHEELKLCVQIMGLTMAIHFIYSLYCGGLFGLQKQVLANTINIAYSFSRSAIVIIPLLISPTIITFFVWQLISIFFCVVVVRYFLIKSITIRGEHLVFHADYLRAIWKFAFGMMLMSIISALNTQLDKLVIGNVLSLRDMGYYSLSSTIGVAVFSIVQPLGTAFYPELTRLLSCNREKMEHLLLLFTYIVSAISVVVGVTLFLYIDEFTYLWTHDQTIVQSIKIPARLLIIGNIFQSLQLSPYYLALANGHTKTNVKLGIFMLLFVIPAVYFFTINWGIIGTAIPYVVINLCATLFLAIIIINRFLSGKLFIWLKYTLIPIGVTLLIVILPYLCLKSVGFNGSALLLLVIGAFIGIIALYFSVRVLVYIDDEVIDYVPIGFRKYIL